MEMTTTQTQTPPTVTIHIPMEEQTTNGHTAAGAAHQVDDQPITTSTTSTSLPLPSLSSTQTTVTVSKSSTSPPLAACPEESASCLSFTYLWWLNSLFSLGGTKTLEESDVPAVRTDYAAEFVAQRFAEGWQREKKRYDEEESVKEEAGRKVAEEQPTKTGDANVTAAASLSNSLPTTNKPVSLNFNPTDKIGFSSYRLLFRVLYGMYGRRFLYSGLLKFGYDATNFAQPILLSAFVKHIVQSQDATRTPPPEWHGYALAAGMFGVAFVGITFANIFQRLVVGIGLRCRTALITVLYRKSLRLSPAARSQMSTGQIVNMMSVDATMVDQASGWAHMAWTAVTQLIVATILLILALGPSALVGMGIMLAFAPMQAYVLSGLRFARRSALKYTDQRIRLLSEILQGIRVIKVYAWENRFIQQISELRENELKFVRSAAFIRGRNAVQTQLAPILMALGSFIVLGVTGNTLSPANVFSSVVLFNLLRTPLLQIPNALNIIADAQIGLNRIQKFLLAEELSELPERLTPNQAIDDVQRDQDAIHANQCDPALKAAYDSLLIQSPSPSATSPSSLMDRFAIKIESAEFSWDILPEQIVQDDDPKKLASAASGRGGSNANRGGKAVEITSSAASNGVVKSERNGAPANGHASNGKSNGRATAAAEENKDLLASSSPAPEPLGVEVRKIAPSVLFDITLLIPAGKLTIICGSVGAGKSSLLSGLLGEMKRKHGKVKIAGTVGYCAQQAWIQNTNVRNNILFGREYDEKRYQETIRVCALTRDLKVLPDGDLTEIGEKGINLSGGQKQRVNLARAYYFNSDIVLMDDPLSAVDAHVSKYLFHECIQGAMGVKTRVLVTHQLQYVPKADYVIFLKDGRIKEMGQYESMMARNGEFATLFRTHGGGDQKEGEKEGEEEESKEGTEKKQELKDEAAKKLTKKDSAPGAAPRALMTTEERAKGGLSWTTWWYYLRSFGGVFWVTVIMFSVMLQIAIRLFNDIWLAGWSDDKYNRSNEFYIAIYGGLGVALSFALFFNIMLQAQRGYIAARQIHDRTFNTLLRAPMSFFDTTPIGRILNRFSRDQDVIDNGLSDSLRMLSFLGAGIIGVLVIMCFVQPWFIVALVPIVYLYWYFQKVYRRVNREIKRMESTSRSPLFAHFSETLTGLPTIRAYGQQAAFIRTNAERMDENNRFYFMTFASQRWLGTRLEILGGFIIFSTAIIAASNSRSIAAGLVGLTLSYAMQVTNMFNFFLRQSVECENFMNSVERSKFYTDGIVREAPPVLPGDDAPELSHDVWPSHGHIRFENVSMRYREGLKLVLQNVNLNIEGGQRIGIVGRTGAGKSSLMVALFRLVEICGGRILIDDQDIGKLGLDKLRQSMAIIPQDPILFSGTVRTNLDPFHEYSDDAIWSVLKKAHLYDHIIKLDGQLSGTVAENGENFSVGQKCQICLARAMLKNAKILIMDEATASVDMETDSLIQESLRTYFQSCTILTIAHRLATIMDYDQVMVLDFGEIKEFDSPANLLRKPASESNLFLGLVNETGPQTSELLKQLAFDAEKANAQRQLSLGNSFNRSLAGLLDQALHHPSSRESSLRRRTVALTQLKSPTGEDDSGATAVHPSKLIDLDAAAEEHSQVHWHDDLDDDDGPDANNMTEIEAEEQESLLSTHPSTTSATPSHQMTTHTIQVQMD